MLGSFPAYCCASWEIALCPFSSAPKPEVEMLALDAVPELSEAVECDPPREDPEVELETALPFKDRLEPVAAMGVETLLAVGVESDNGNARVTDALDPFAGGVNGTSNGSCGAGLNLAVAGDMRTEKEVKSYISYMSTQTYLGEIDSKGHASQ